MPSEPPSGTRVTYTQQFRRCGKRDCSVCSHGEPGHGPYWYAYWRQDGRVRTRYIGRRAPVAQAAASPAFQSSANVACAPALAAASLRVRTLGAFQVWRGAEALPGTLWGRRGCGVLFKCLLAAPGYRLRREQAVELLWPDADPAIGAANLRLATYQLRKALDVPGAGYVQSAERSLQLAPMPGGTAPPGWLDAEAFAGAAETALAGSDVSTCRAALALYGGDYLPDDVYAEWTVARRDDLRRLYQGVLVHLAGLYTSRGNVHAALQALQRMLQLDPCHEAAARSAMRLYAASSRRAEAIRAYYCLADALRRELALRPEPETQALFRALQHQELPLQ